MHRFCPRLVHSLSLSLSRSANSVSFPLPRCLKLEFQVSRSEIRFDDSTWSGAEGEIRNRSRARGLVAERARERRREKERERGRENAGRCSKLADKNREMGKERRRRIRGGGRSKRRKERMFSRMMITIRFSFHGFFNVARSRYYFNNLS